MSFASQEKAQLALYYSPSCPYCQEVLKYLHSVKKTVFLKNVKKDPEAKKELKTVGGVLEVPCLIIDNKQAIYSSPAIIQWMQEHSNDF